MTFLGGGDGGIFDRRYKESAASSISDSSMTLFEMIFLFYASSCELNLSTGGASLTLIAFSIIAIL